VITSAMTPVLASVRNEFHMGDPFGR